MSDHDRDTTGPIASTLVRVRELLRRGDHDGALALLEAQLPPTCGQHDARHRDDGPARRERLSLNLSTREREVLVWLPTHLTNAEIGRQLHMSVNTVKSHLKGLYVTLGVRSRSEAVTIARRRGLLDGCPHCGAQADPVRPGGLGPDRVRRAS